MSAVIRKSSRSSRRLCWNGKGRRTADPARGRHAVIENPFAGNMSKILPS